MKVDLLGYSSFGRVPWLVPYLNTTGSKTMIDQCCRTILEDIFAFSTI
jgi:hypothetical protein